MKYLNPWSNHSGFVDLGEHTIKHTTDKRCQRIDHYDLYAIVNFPKSISFGARYSNVDSAYISGNAYLNPSGVWELTVHGETALAAARFFANHHPNIDPK